MNLAQFLMLMNTPASSPAVGISIIQKQLWSSATNIPSINVTLSSVLAGDTIFVAFSEAPSESTWTLVVNDSAGNTYTQVARTDTGSGAPTHIVFRADASADATGLVVTTNWVGHQILGTQNVYQLRNAGVTGTPATFSAGTLQPAGTVLQTPAYSVGAGGFILYLAGAFVSTATSMAETVSATPAYTVEQDFSPPYFGSGRCLQSGSVLAASAVSGAQTSFALATTPSASYRAGMIVVPVEHA